MLNWFIAMVMYHVASFVASMGMMIALMLIVLAISGVVAFVNWLFTR